jgi:hypothetical protein
MRALVLRGDYDIGVEDRPDPRPGPGQVVARCCSTQSPSTRTFSLLITLSPHQDS